MTEVVDLDEVAESIDRAWAPVDLVCADGTLVRPAKLDGEFPWHRHDEDELFLCAKGAFRIDLAERPAVELRAGQLFLVPKGAEHRPETLQDGNNPA